MPAWVGSILTSLSLFLAFRILLRDSKAKTRALADAFVTWHDQTFHRTLTGKFWTLNVYAHNTSDAPVPYATVRYRTNANDWLSSQTLMDHGGADAIDPKERVSTEIRFDEQPHGLRAIISFVDAAGKRWHRDVRTGNYISERSYKRFVAKAIDPNLLGVFADPIDLFRH